MFLLMCISFYNASFILGTKNRLKLWLTYKAGRKKGDYFGKGYATTRLCVDLVTALGMKILLVALLPLSILLFLYLQKLFLINPGMDRLKL